MIHPNLLKRQANRDRLTAAAVERDYILTHVLTAIAARDTEGQIAFKGGTALRLCHFDSYRYSADLDFSLLDDMDLDRARPLIAAALDDCRETLGLPALRLTDATPPRIEYVGPLASKPRTLKLDLADDELVESTARLAIISRYPDQEPRGCLVYTLEEVAAEKLRCVIQTPSMPRPLRPTRAPRHTRGRSAGDLAPLRAKGQTPPGGPKSLRRPLQRPRA